MNARMMAMAGLAALLLAAGGAMADVRSMGPGLTSLETVPVGNPGNTGEWSGESYGGYGPDRICGAVDYEYRIGKYEVTAAQYTEFLNKVAGVDAYGLYNTEMWRTGYGCKIERYAGSGTTGAPYEYRVASDCANRPVNYVSWEDAARFANWLHNGQPTGAQDLSTTEDGPYHLNGATTNAELMAVNRETDAKWAITSEDEWYKAAYHKNDGNTGNYWDYPTGTNSVPGRDMTETVDPGNNANYSGNPDYTTVAGEFELSQSPYGTFDQGGNVFELNEATIWFGSMWVRGLRGGCFQTGVGTLHAAYRDNYPTAHGDDDIGFRVSEVPEPASMAILALGGLAMVRGRRA